MSRCPDAYTCELKRIKQGGCRMPVLLSDVGYISPHNSVIHTYDRPVNCSTFCWGEVNLENALCKVAATGIRPHVVTNHVKLCKSIHSDSVSQMDWPVSQSIFIPLFCNSLIIKLIRRVTSAQNLHMKSWDKCEMFPQLKRGSGFNIVTSL